MDAAQDPDPRETEIVAVLAAARAHDRAPPRLRTRVERERAARRARGRGLPVPSRALAGALAAAVACVAIALALILPAETPGTPTVAQAAALAVRGPAQAAPSIARRPRGTWLDQSVDEIYFPDWHATLGWRAIGERTDTLSGRRAVTVFYQRGTTEVAYTIVATPPLPEPNATMIRAGSMTVRALSISGRTTVTWRRSGDTCVLSSTGLSAHALARLAAWSDRPGVT